MGPSEIKPYVELLTWQVVTVLGGLIFLPAVYVLIFRISEFDFMGVKGKLEFTEANAVVKAAEEEVAADIESGVSPTETLEAAADASGDTPRERFKTAMKDDVGFVSQN